MMLFKRTVTFLVGAVLMVSLFACAPNRPSTEGTTTASSVIPTEGTGTTISTTGTANETKSTGLNTTALAEDTRSAFSLFGKSWKSFDPDTQRFLENCGLTQEIVEGNKQQLTYRKDLSSKFSPFYQTYTNGETRYSFNDPNGKLTFLSLERVENDVLKTEDEIQATARRIADLLIDRSRYEEDFFLSDTKLYYTEYIKTVHGYQTFDRVGICITRSGKVKHVAVSKIGSLDNVPPPQVDDTAVLNYCDTFLRKQYSFDRCEIIRKELDIKDGQLLAYYQNQPEISDGQVVLICSCQMFVNDAKWGRIQTVLVPV